VHGACQDDAEHFEVREHVLSMHHQNSDESKAKYTDIAVRSPTCHTTTGTHMPYRITQCYLPPDRGDIPAFTPAEAVT